MFLHSSRPPYPKCDSKKTLSGHVLASTENVCRFLSQRGVASRGVTLGWCDPIETIPAPQPLSSVSEPTATFSTGSCSPALKPCALAALRRMNKDCCCCCCSSRRRTCRVMPGNWLQALVCRLPSPLLQDKSSLASCPVCAADLAPLQKYFSRLFLDVLRAWSACLTFPLCCGLCIVFFCVQQCVNAWSRRNAAALSFPVKTADKSLRGMQQEPPRLLLSSPTCSRFAARGVKRRDVHLLFQTGNTGSGSVNSSYSTQRWFPGKVWFVYNSVGGKRINLY